MMRKRNLMIFLLACSGVLLLGGCAGKQGPMGPDGPGTQTLHTLNVSPASASATYDIVASEVVVDPGNGDNSTVACYVIQSTAQGVEVAMPATVIEPDNTTTDYFYQVRSGVVTVGWRNSANTIPKASQFVVMVINKN